MGRKFELLNASDHANIIAKNGREGINLRPDITHQVRALLLKITHGVVLPHISTPPPCTNTVHVLHACAAYYHACVYAAATCLGASTRVCMVSGAWCLVCVCVAHAALCSRDRCGVCVRARVGGDGCFVFQCLHAPMPGLLHYKHHRLLTSPSLVHAGVRVRVRVRVRVHVRVHRGVLA